MQVSPRVVEVTRIRSPVIPEIYVMIIIRKINVVFDISVYGILWMFLAVVFDIWRARGIEIIVVRIIVVRIRVRC